VFLIIMGVLELELDDWLDPSLPRLYTDAEFEPTEPVLSDEFTASNEEFVETCVLPPYLPVRMVQGRFVFERRILDSAGFSGI
jgi:hypothetical protein